MTKIIKQVIMNNQNKNELVVLSLINSKMRDFCLSELS